MKKLLSLSLLFLGVISGAQAQTCTTTISSFPYTENFEGAGPQVWTSGGTLSTWGLGKPFKQIINSAASGVNVWATNLNGNYNANEKSFVESPCFNMSSLSQPVIELKVWWNCNFSYTGAVLQSSIDNGATWQVVGAKGDPYNWYNDNTINGGPGGQTPTSALGWTGKNATGNGSGGWVNAKHALTGLGGKPNVKLRIAFASDGATVLADDDGFAFDDVAIYEKPANDAGVAAITAPVSPAIPGNQTPVSITVKNYGASPLTAATFGFSVNGAAQPAFTWSGNVAPNATSTPIQIGTFNFLPGTHTIKAWSKSPNNATDADITNDSASVSITACHPLSGVYTINGGAAASATNFKSFSAAVQALSICGVSGPVTFNVAPASGPYNEQIILPAIAGTSAANTITFEGNGNTVSGAGTTTYPGLFAFNGADYVKLNNLIINLNLTGTATGAGVYLTNASDNNTVSNCIINLPLTSTSDTKVNGVAAGAPNTNGNHAINLLVQNNIINGGYYGVLFNGPSTGTASTNCRVIGNKVLDQYANGIYMYYGNGALIERNDLSRPTRLNVSNYQGVVLAGVTLNAVVNRNSIHNTHDNATNPTSSVYGISVTSSATVGNENIIKNNIIYNINNSGGTFYGFYNNVGSGAHYYHNTVYTNVPGVTHTICRGVLFNSASTNLKFVNNNISLPGNAATGKHAIYVNNTGAALISNYNNLYVGTTGNIGYFGADKATLADWKTANANAYDQNSVSADPLFVSGTNLQPMEPALNNAGQAAAAVAEDFTGATRNATTPDMGAYEFMPATNDAGIVAINAPTSPVAPGNQPVQVTLKNFGSATLTSATIGWKVNNVTQTPYSWTGSLNSLQATSAPVSIGNYTFPTGNVILKVWSFNPNGAADGMTVNDTIILNLTSCEPLAGAYTINKNNPTAGTNFQSINEAVARLNSCGVYGPVTLTVASGTGPYNEQVEIRNIPYTSATNTVTFEGSGNTVSTVPGLRPGVIVLNGAKNVKLNNFVIELAATATTGAGVQLINAADNNIISNNTINLPSSTAEANLIGILAGSQTATSANNASNTKIQNNTLNGGFYSIYLNGAAVGLNSENNQITGNQIRDFYSYGIYINGASATLIEGNDFSRPVRTSVSSFTGVQLVGTCNNTIVSKNRMHNTHDAANTTSSSVYGIYNDATTSAGNEIVVKNNLIYNANNTTGGFYGIYHKSGNGVYYYHNTISSMSGISYGTLRGVHFAAASTNVKFINNIISLPENGTTKHAVYINNAGIQLTCNNNDYFIGTTGKIGYYTSADKATLADWQAVNTNAYDQNSVSVDPAFLNLATGNLKPNASAIDNLGQPVAAVTHDILGATRNATTPDLGAYEFGIPANDVGIIAVSGPNATGCGLTTTENVTVTIKNFGANTQTTIPVSYTVNGTGTVTETYTGSIAPNGTDTYTFNAKADLTVSGAYKIVATTQLSGDIFTNNDADTLEMVNSMVQLTGIPYTFDFETPAAGIASFSKTINSNSNIVEDVAASFGTGGKGLLLDGIDQASWLVPAGTIDPWTNNSEHFAGAYICFNPSNLASPDSLWMTFDLKQLFKNTNANTNFRITVNGTQVGPTYRPPFDPANPATPIAWKHYKVDLSQYKNAASLSIGFESNVKEAYNNGVGTANLVDNISFKRLLAKPQTGVKDASFATQLNVFPNPSSGIFNVELPKGKTYELVVTDLTGKVLKKQSATGATKLNLEGTAKGIYLLKVSGENGTAVRKLIVE